MPDLSAWSTGRLLTTAARLVEQSWNQRLAELDVTHAGFTALAVLAGYGPLRQAQLAELVHVQAQTIGKTLNRLEAKGHIERTRGDDDRRSQTVRITEKGLATLEKGRNIERTLVSDEALLSPELRSHLQAAIEELAEPQRQVRGRSGLHAVEDQ
ncbi:hypothetical protein GCM10009784_07740 [Arthrobacter parietis]|uniref:HTH marR-type domain-containing protein n=1 Tax=Arthrobacter parietis TaxID=271434 RepID=A0ABN3AQE1_9MICC